MNKTTAGYHILMILAQVDGHLDKEEQKIIAQYIKAEFEFQTEMDLEEINPYDYSTLFYKSMDIFYANSTIEERNNFLSFAMKLVKADSKISTAENTYLSELFSNWENQEL